MIPKDPEIPQGGVAGGGHPSCGLETHRFPHAVSLKGCSLTRRTSRGSYLRARVRGKVPRRSSTSASMIEWPERERVSNQPLGLPGHWPMTTARVVGRNAVRACVGSLPARPTGLQLDVGLIRSLPSICHKLLHVEDGSSDEHVIGRPSELVCKDRQSLSLSVLALELLEQVLTFGVFLRIPVMVNACSGRR